MKLKKGDPVQIHAAHDLYMRGVKHATVLHVGTKWITVEGNISKTKHKISRRHLLDQHGNPLPKDTEDETKPG